MKSPLLASALAAVALMSPCAPSMAVFASETSASTSVPLSAAGFFRDDVVHALTLSFSAENRAAMEPSGDSRAGARPADFGPRHDPGSDLAKAWIRSADKDADGRLSRSEFETLGESWFAGGKPVLESEAPLKGLLSDGPGGGPAMRGANGKNGMAAALGIEFKYVRATLSASDGTSAEVGVRLTGNNTYLMSRGATKRPLKVKADKFADGRRVFGVSKFNLRNNVNDPSAMAEALSYALYRDAGVPAPRTTYASVALETQGAAAPDRLGLYTAVENIDKDFLKNRFGVKKSAPGALFKPSTRALFEYLGEDWSKYEARYAPAFKITDADKARVIAFSRLVSRADDREFAEKLASFLDLDETARFLAVTVWLSSLDSILEMGQNYYLYLEPKTGRFLLLPWDLDHSFGRWMRADTASLSISHPWSGENRFLERLFATPAFRSKYDAYMAEFGKNLFTPEGVEARMKRLDKVVRPAVAAESPAALRRYEAEFGGPSAAAGSGGKSAASGRSGPRAEEPIPVFMKKRAAFVQASLAGKAPSAPPSSRSGGGPGGPGGPGAFVASALSGAMDANRDGAVSRDEALAAIRAWTSGWDADKDGLLSEAELAGGLRGLMPAFPSRGDPGRAGEDRDGPPDEGFGPPPHGEAMPPPPEVSEDE